MDFTDWRVPFASICQYQYWKGFYTTFWLLCCFKQSKILFLYHHLCCDQRTVCSINFCPDLILLWRLILTYLYYLEGLKLRVITLSLSDRFKCVISWVNVWMCGTLLDKTTNTFANGITKFGGMTTTMTSIYKFLCHFFSANVKFAPPFLCAHEVGCSCKCVTCVKSLGFQVQAPYQGLCSLFS